MKTITKYLKKFKYNINYLYIQIISFIFVLELKVDYF